jgi:hypothetical protein
MVPEPVTLSRLAVATLLAVLAVAAPASAADPIMPLSDVRSGMQCTSLSVIQGTEPASFDIEVLDVIDGDPSLDGARILVRASGPAVDVTGIGPGFSGSPIYCPDAQGVQRNIGAISESVGEYGGKVVLATPIEAIVGTPLSPPRASRSRVGSAVKPLAAPLTIAGVRGPLARVVSAAGARAGRPVMTVPAGPFGSYPVQTLRPGSAMAVGMSVGELTIGAVGTVAYVDGTRVWGFGHPFDNAGRRALFLQDAYIFRVINNPNQIPELGGTYKYGVGGHAVGLLRNDARDAVVGRVGALPTSIPVRVYTHDDDTRTATESLVRVADESRIGNPVDGSPLQFIAPLALTQSVSSILGAEPSKLTGRMCLQIVIREVRQPVRFCNRYVATGGFGGDFGFGNMVASQAASDMAQAVAIIDSYQFRPLHVLELSARVHVSRGADLAYLRKVRLPRRVRAGQRVEATLVVRHLGGRTETRRVTMRVPRELRPGRRKLLFEGYGSDSGEASLVDIFGEALEFEEVLDVSGDAGPETVEAVVRQIRAIRRWDGVTVRRAPRNLDDLFDEEEPEPSHAVYRDKELRIAGRAIVPVRVLGRR